VCQEVLQSSVFQRDEVKIVKKDMKALHRLQQEREGFMNIRKIFESTVTPKSILKIFLKLICLKI
jgi:hypothetical protein